MIDVATLRELTTVCADDAPAAAQLIAEYVDDLRLQLAAFDDAIAASDWSRVGKLAHRLRANAALFGAHALSTAASTLEQACVTQPHMVLPSLGVFREELVSACEALSALRGLD